MKGSVFDKEFMYIPGIYIIFIWIFTFHDVLKYFQGKVFSDNKIPGWLSPFLQFLLSYLKRELLLKKDNHYRVEKNFRKLWKSWLFHAYFGLKFSKMFLRFFF